jgi:hypothetical protein
VLSLEEETLIARKHTLLLLDDCLYALQATVPQLSTSASSGQSSHTKAAIEP